MANKFEGDLRVIGDFQADSMSLPNSSVTNATVSPNAAIVRSKLAQDVLATYPILMTDWHVHNAPQTKLPNPSASDDLGIYGATTGTDSLTLKSSDLKAAGATTLYARTTITLPPEYDDGQTIEIRLSAGMLTTIADVSATIDVECYKSDREGGVGADICATSAQDINNLTLADKDFTITPSGLVAGDILDVRITMAINDASTGTTVQGIIGAVERRYDIKG